jgi:hypothetical protein
MPVAMTMVAATEDDAGGLADTQRQIGRDHAVRRAADAVRAEILASHRACLPSLSRVAVAVYKTTTMHAPRAQVAPCRMVKPPRAVSRAAS